jgi:integrase
MANTHFILRTLKAKTPQILYLRFRVESDIDFKFPLGIKILPKFWNKDTERVKNVIECIERTEINNYLNELVDTVEVYKNLKASKRENITRETLRQFLSDYIKPTDQNEKTLIGYLVKHIEQSKTAINANTGQTIKKNSVYAYVSLLESLQAFQKEQRRVIDFENINIDFYNSFIKFLTQKGLAKNTIGKKIVSLKSVLNRATEQGINKNLSYKAKAFRTINEESDNIYLTSSELEIINSIELNERLDRVRDLFLIGAYTGLRFSDFTRITSNNIQGEFIHIHQQKTGQKVVIPLHPVVVVIMKKYGGQAPKPISSQKMNEYLKEIGELANLSESVTKTITKGGLKVSQNLTKADRLTTHTARRSFATNLYLEKYPAQMIMQITGHKTETAFLKYIKVTKEETANDLLQHYKENYKLKKA